MAAAVVTARRELGMPDRRRPPSLTCLGTGDPGGGVSPAPPVTSVSLESKGRSLPPAGAVIDNGAAQKALKKGLFNLDCGEEVYHCIEGLRSELDSNVSRLQRQLESILQRRPSAVTTPQLELDRIAERQPLTLTPGWNSAPAEGRNVKKLITQNLQDMDVESLCSETPRKLPPPPTPGTPVQPTTPNVSNVVMSLTATTQREKGVVAFKFPDVAGSPRSESSTRTGTNSCSDVKPFVPLKLEEEAASSLSYELPVKVEADASPPCSAGFTARNGALPRMTGRWIGPAKDSKVSPNEEPISETPSEKASLQRINSWVTPKSQGSGSEHKYNFSPLSSRHNAKVMLFSRSNTVQITKRFTKTQTYELISAVLILLNALLIVYETDWRATFAASQDKESVQEYEGSEGYDYFFMAGNMFCVIFVLDLVLRIFTERQMFLRSRERGWNFFDIFVCVTAVFEALVQWYMQNAPLDSELRIFLRKFSMLRILRLLRVIRVARALKVIKFIRELRMMVFCLTSSLRSLGWSAVLITIILMVFAVFFTDGVVGYCQHHGLMHAEATQEMRRFFGRVPMATVSLFMAMTGGEDWGNILVSLAPLPIEYSILFIAFVSFGVLALLNLVTAVFMNTAIQRSQNDREFAVQQELESKAELVTIIQQVFMELDTDGSGSLSKDEFEKHEEDEKIQAYLKSRQIDIGQVRTLFTLLDGDQTGEIGMDDFVQGILRLKGGATSMDLAVLTYQVEYMMQMLSEVAGTEKDKDLSAVSGLGRMSMAPRRHSNCSDSPAARRP